jgi:aminoglycoside phosphotransferase
VNTLLTFLKSNWQRLDLARYGTPDRLSCVIITPRFRASSHVVFLLLADGQPDPMLVAKVPRLAEASDSLRREAANLSLIQSIRSGGFDSIPRIVAFEEYGGRPLLIETALAGQPMDRRMVRRHLTRCCEAALAWLTEVQSSLSGANESTKSWFERQVEAPLDHVACAFSASAEEVRLLEETRDLVAPLRDEALPLVVEHGDLSHPNLFLLQSGGLGVVDWELAEPHGLPTHDLFFFLCYVAFAWHDARKHEENVSAFHTAFFGRSAWARRYVQIYADRLRLPPRVLTPLFVLGWVRYMAGLLTRLGETDHVDGVGADTVTWLRSNRYYALWRHALAHLDELRWDSA